MTAPGPSLPPEHFQARASGGPDSRPAWPHPLAPELALVPPTPRSPGFSAGMELLLTTPGPWENSRAVLRSRWAASCWARRGPEGCCTPPGPPSAGLGTLLTLILSSCPLARPLLGCSPCPPPPGPTPSPAHRAPSICLDAPVDGGQGSPSLQPRARGRGDSGNWRVSGGAHLPGGVHESEWCVTLRECVCATMHVSGFAWHVCVVSVFVHVCV